jgi:4-hydroxybenzoate polyprenyltransferase
MGFGTRERASMLEKVHTEPGLPHRPMFPERKIHPPAILVGRIVKAAPPEQAATDVRIMTTLSAALRLIRPTQWIKNGFVLMPLIFAHRLLDPSAVFMTLETLAAFCFASSITYIFNDYMDMEQDKVHPLKKKRPLASGEISPRGAFMIAAALVAGLIGLFTISSPPLIVYLLLLSYLILHVAYSYTLKDIVILDVMAIALGFVIRVSAGAFAIEVDVSSWLVLCAFSLALFLALGKRRHEVVILCDDASCHRPVLENYNVALLDQLLQVVTTATFIFYCLYSVRDSGVSSQAMMFTIPMVTYGIFRYMYLIYLREDGGSPTAILLTDRPLMLCGIIWLITCVAIIYYHP